MSETIPCDLTNEMVNALLLQVEPGCDSDTINEIREKFGNKVNVFGGFGRYDFILISETKEFELIKAFHEKGLDHVIDWFPIWGLRWASRVQGKQKWTGDRKLLGFSLIKIDIDYGMKTGNSPVKQEQEIVSHIQSDIPESLIFCNLGFNELFVLIEADSVNDLAQKIVVLKKCTIKNGYSLTLDISTIPAVGIRFLEAKNGKDAAVKEVTKAYFLMSLRLGLSKSFKEKLDTILGNDCISLFGFHDLLFELTGDTKEIIKKILKIRSEGKPYGLYSSGTLISHKDEALDFLVPEGPSSEKTIGLPVITNVDEQINFYKTWFKTSRQDLLTRHIFEDQTTFFSTDQEAFHKDFLSKRDLDADDNFFRTQELDSLRECLRVGFEQRTSGIVPGNLLGPKSIRTEPLGSTQRATMAIESVPQFLFKNLNLGDWPGFCIHGYASRFYRTENGIINIPHQYRVLPEMWWGVYHEVGHEVFSHVDEDTKIKIIDGVRALADSVLRKHRNSANLNQKILKGIYMEFADEVFAEIFGFHFGFNDDWSLYINHVWSYFSRELKLDHEHLSRSILVYFTMGPGKGLSHDEITTEKIDTCIDQIEKVTIKANKREISDIERDRAIVVVLYFLDIADVVKEYLINSPCFYDSKRIEETRKHLENGEISFDANPLELLYSLVKTFGKPDFKHRFAAILSLYDRYSTELVRKNIGDNQT